MLNLLEHYGIVEQVFAICCDTTASNTGVHKGAIQILTKILDRQVLWIMCRHHIYEVHISHFMAALTGEKTKAPRRGIYVRLQKIWPSVVERVQMAAQEKTLVLFDWSSIQVGSPLHTQALKSLQFCSRALQINTFSRGDYKKLCQLVVVFLGGELEQFRLPQPGACHEARFMADALYLLTLHMTKSVLSVMSEEEESMVSKASMFTGICYAPWFLQSYIGERAPSNDLEAFKVSLEFQRSYGSVGLAVMRSMERQAWFLTEQLVILALADEDVPKEERDLMVENLMKVDVPEEFLLGKPTLPEMSQETKLADLIGDQSWSLLSLLEIGKEEVKTWMEADVSNNLSYQKFAQFVKNLETVNDCAERNVKLIQDYLMTSKSEDQRQNIMLVAKDNCKKLKKDCGKEGLKKV